MTPHKWYVLLPILAFIVLIGCELLYIQFNGRPVPVPDIPRDIQQSGNGTKLSYAIMGDSTAVGQGADYADGIAIATVNHLSKNYHVYYKNVAVSGARMADVKTKQLPDVLDFKPDIVLISAGANDVTHLTNVKQAANDLASVIDSLKRTDPNVKIIITGSPQMGSIPRFPQPIRWFAELRTGMLNNALLDIVHAKNVTLAPIAQKTGPIFSRNPGLFASDKFHPNAAGYKTWVPILNDALDGALKDSKPTD